MDVMVGQCCIIPSRKHENRSHVLCFFYRSRAGKAGKKQTRRRYAARPPHRTLPVQPKICTDQCPGTRPPLHCRSRAPTHLSPFR